MQAPELPTTSHRSGTSPDPILSTGTRRVETTAVGISLGVSILLLVLKFTAYFFTWSSAVFSDAMESIVNVIASSFALYAIILAHAPADQKHPYGHGKIEFLSAGLEGWLILLASIAIAVQGATELITGPRVHSPDIGLVLLAIAMIVNGACGAYLIHTGSRSGSATLIADGKHLLSDSVTSGAILVALGMIWLHPSWKMVDPIAALLVAAYLLFTGISLLRASFAGLMDEQDIEDDKMLRGILDSHVAPAGAPPRICSYHKLRHRHSGRYHWVDFHIMVPADWTVAQGHEVASSIEYEIEQALGVGNATAHIEPCATPQCVACG
jgi:cation diffusion facilitator family transporter